MVHKDYSPKGSPYGEYYYANGQVISKKMFGLHGQITPGKEETIKTNGGLMYYQYDGTRNVTELTNRHGEEIEHYRYDAFGNILTGITAPYNTISFTGHEYDKGSGLTYMNARWYDSQVGRFTSMDTYFGTMTNPQSQNLYAYVMNNPVNMWDPSGNIARYTWNDLINRSIPTLRNMIQTQSDYWFDDYDISLETGEWTEKQHIAHANANLMRDVIAHIEAHTYHLVNTDTSPWGAWELLRENRTIDYITYYYERTRTVTRTYENDFDSYDEIDYEYQHKDETITAAEYHAQNEEFKLELMQQLVGDPPEDDDLPTLSISTRDGIISEVNYYDADGTKTGILEGLQDLDVLPDNPVMNDTSLNQIRETVFGIGSRGSVIGNGVEEVTLTNSLSNSPRAFYTGNTPPSVNEDSSLNAGNVGNQQNSTSDSVGTTPMHYYTTTGNGGAKGSGFINSSINYIVDIFNVEIGDSKSLKIPENPILNFEIELKSEIDIDANIQVNNTESDLTSINVYNNKVELNVNTDVISSSVALAENDLDIDLEYQIEKVNNDSKISQNSAMTVIGIPKSKNNITYSTIPRSESEPTNSLSITLEYDGKPVRDIFLGAISAWYFGSKIFNGGPIFAPSYN